MHSLPSGDGKRKGMEDSGGGFMGQAWQWPVSLSTFLGQNSAPWPYLTTREAGKTICIPRRRGKWFGEKQASVWHFRSPLGTKNHRTLETQTHRMLGP